jgi:hypothetical protein
VEEHINKNIKLFAKVDANLIIFFDLVFWSGAVMLTKFKKIIAGFENPKAYN